METAIGVLVGVIMVGVLIAFIYQVLESIVQEIVDFIEHMPIYISIPIALIVVGLILYFILIRFSWVQNMSNKPRYVICPYCDKSILFTLDWECRYCGEFQGVVRAVDKPCIHCRRKSKNIWCSSCKKEVLL